MKVSVCCITYNHEKFIADALEGFLMQDFDDYEIVISDDASTDGTADILRQYQAKNPHRIKLLLNSNNIGMMRNLVQALKACSGDYIALCEGDDYWISPLKLKRQFNLLEHNKSIVLCFHDALTIDQESNELWQFGEMFKLNDKILYTIQDVIQRWFMPTCSLFFRANTLEFPDWFNEIKNGDMALVTIIAQYGNIKYIDEVMGVYRKHLSGVSQQFSGAKLPLSRLVLLGYLEKYLAPDHRGAINRARRMVFKTYFDKNAELDSPDNKTILRIFKSYWPVKGILLKALFAVNKRIFKIVCWRII